ncbi:MAG: DegV family protein [Lachnospiraceae bacterium]|nr:DegV family protein [Lachnospiraceae bacterium]
MASFILSCCSTADLTVEYLKERDIKYTCFHFTIGNDTYPDDMGESISHAERYRRMIAGEDAKTSQVTVAQYVEYFESFLKEGKDVLHLTLSSGITGTLNSAILAKEELDEKYPDRKLIVIDSLAASSGYGLLMDYLADLRDEGKSIDEVAAWAEEHKLNIHHWFFSSDLTFFIKGGRVSKTAGFFGQLLSICPLLNVDFMGRLIPREKVKSKKRVIKRIVEKMVENAEGGVNYDGKCFISNSECLKDAVEVADLIGESIPALKGKVKIFDIGGVIGSHTGPGTVALFFYGNKRED